MKYILKRNEKKKVSPIVLRAISRMNNYENKKSTCSVVWDGKSINYLSINL